MPQSTSPASRSTMAIGAWRKASHCNSGECVELAPLADTSIGMRDSKDLDAGTLHLSRSQMAALVDGIKAGELDHLA